jgi:hypothetical protein
MRLPRSDRGLQKQLFGESRQDKMLGDKISLIASRLVNVIIRFLQMRFPVRLHIECAECNWEASCDGSCFPFSS